MGCRAQLYSRPARAPNTSYLLDIRVDGMRLPIVRVTEFYYILRQADERNALKSVSAIGPLNELEYQSRRK